MKALADLSIVLDLMLDRQPWVKDVAALWQANHERRLELCMAAFAVPTLFYIVHRQKDKVTAHAAVRAVLDALTILPVDRWALEVACTYSGSDFEDNLHIACAVQAQTDAIITRDAKGFQGSPLPVWTPTEALTQIPSN